MLRAQLWAGGHLSLAVSFNGRLEGEQGRCDHLATRQEGAGEGRMGRIQALTASIPHADLTEASVGT